MDQYRFRQDAFKKNAPYYDKYRGHTFTVTRIRGDSEHVRIVCTSDASLVVESIVHFNDLERI